MKRFLNKAKSKIEESTAFMYISNTIRSVPNDDAKELKKVIIYLRRCGHM